MGGGKQNKKTKTWKKLKGFKLQRVSDSLKKIRDQKMRKVDKGVFVENLQVWGERLQKRDWRKLPNYMRIWEKR